MLIGLTGPKQAGKDTVFERASHLLDGVLPVERASFADLLYRSAAASLGVTVAELQEWKNDPCVGVAVVSLHDDFHELTPEGIGRFKEPLTVREYLQRYGTEAHREVFGSDFWVDNLRLADHPGAAVFVTDVRFENEALAVLKVGGYVVRVVGPDEIENAGDGHASEAGLPDYLIYTTLRNHVRGDGFRSLDEQVALLIRDALMDA